MSAKATLPWLRWRVTRPATLTGSVRTSSWTGYSATGPLTRRCGCSNSPIAWWAVGVRSNREANGSMPCSRSLASLARRCWRSSAPPTGAGWCPAPPSSASTAEKSSGAPGKWPPLLDRKDVQGAAAAWRGHLDLVACALAQQRLTDRALQRDQPLLGIGLDRTDDGPVLFAVLVLDLDLGTKLDCAGGFFRRLLDDLGVSDRLLECEDATLDPTLVVLGVLVFGILGDIAELLGAADPVGHLPPLHGEELVKLGLELLQAFLGDRNGLVLQHLNFLKKRTAPRTSAFAGTGTLGVSPPRKSADYTPLRRRCRPQLAIATDSPAPIPSSSSCPQTPARSSAVSRY